MTNTLHRIQSFTELLPYLEEELDWPLQRYGFDDLTFEYTPAELGLKDEDAVKIRQIHQLRPLQSGQPWGIFFVEFEQKKLPVVVLRRILSHLVVKKRASANRAAAAAWQTGDLLFISAYGDHHTNNREIAFAHFHQAEGDLPTLRVLGWDGGDTPLKLEHVATTLKQKLSWPDDPGDHDAWRDLWTQAFRHRIGHVIRTADALAEALAALARRIRQAALILLSHETEQGALRTLHKAFQTALIHDLSTVDFADTYAQTITYGLLTAAISRTEMSEGVAGTALIADNIADIVPVTNPFLKEMLQTFLQVGGRKGGIDFDELGIQDVVELLRGRDTDLPAVLRDFGNKTQGEDPVIHFYEHFLAAYDKKLKIQRGVFYTPKPVVSYIVRSVHELLQTEFGLADGLADTTTWREMAQRHPALKIPAGTDPDSPFVVILDPATGTATFLVEVIAVIYRTLTVKWQKAGLNTTQQKAAWNEYVPRHLLPRLYGYELMMAPYAIAHMKMGLKLYETGYRFTSTERVRIYLTNALEPADDQLVLRGISPALAHEASAVTTVKRQQRFTVIVGNPPYAGYSANHGKWIVELTERYKTTVRQEERQIQRLSNDYVKFFCLCEEIINQSHVGLLGLITDNGYLKGILFRDMRQSLHSTFQRTWILNLHGVVMRGVERRLEIDDNVFDITQGVSVGLFEKTINSAEYSMFQHEDMFGARQKKYSYLIQNNVFNSNWNVIDPIPPKWLFVPTNPNKDYESWLSLTDIIGTGLPKKDRDTRYGTGIKTRHDHFTIGWNVEDVVARISQIINRKEDNETLIENLGLCTTSHFSIQLARRRAEAGNLAPYVRHINYRPFDKRFILYLREFVCEPKTKTMHHMLYPTNVAMAILRRNRKENGSGFFVSRGLTAKDMVSNLDDALIWPLYIYSDTLDLLSLGDGIIKPNANISLAIIKQVKEKFSLSWIDSGSGDLENTIGPQDIFYYFDNVRLDA